MLESERAWRDDLIVALVPAPGGGLPALADRDRAPFWRRFDEAAPLHLRLGLRVASLLCAAVLPRLLGFGGGLGALDAPTREDALRRMAALPLAADLLEIAKVVACFAYFDDPCIQRAIRQAAP